MLVQKNCFIPDYVSKSIKYNSNIRATFNPFPNTFACVHVSLVQVFEHCEKTRICVLQAISPFSTVFSTRLGKIGHSQRHVAGVLGMFQSTVARMWDREDRFVVVKAQNQGFVTAIVL